MKYVGIDPGATGGIAVIYEDGRLWVEGDLTVHSSAEVLRRLLADCDPLDIHAMLEDTNAFADQSSVTTATQFRNIGQLEGLLVALGIPYQMVKGSAWQKAILAGKPSPTTITKEMRKILPKKEIKKIQHENRKKTKAYAAVIAARTFPGHDFRPTPKCTNAHDGKVDAALIAEFCRRTWR